MSQPTLPESPIPDPHSLQADAAWRRFRRGGDPAAIADLFDLTASDLHRTALHLVGDDATAHDLVQTTFLAALEQRTFDDARAVLPWLFGILRNQAALVHRRRARAFDRERIGGEAVADPVAQAADRETIAAVEGALAQLPDTLQPVVRLHLLHGVDAAAIARSLQRPGGTVRTQLVRGLAKLRQLLPVGLGGLLAGLLPSAGRAAVRTAVLAAAQHAPVTAVHAAWWARPRSALLAALGAAVVALAVLFARGERAPAPAPAPSVASTAPAAAAPAQGVADTASPAPSPAARTEVAAAPATFEVRGTVHGTVRGQDGMPVEGAEVLLWCTEYPPVARGRAFEPPPADVATTAADGRFAVRGHGPICYLLARTQGAISEHAIAGELDGRERIDGLELQLGPTVVQRGRLVDQDGRGVAGFSFGTHRGGGRSFEDRLAVVGFSRCQLPHLDVRTDPDGAFAVEAARDYDYLWEVQHPDHPMLRVRHRPADGPVELRLERGATITGTVWRPNGEPALGAAVVLHDYPPRRGSCDGTGTFALRGAWLREGLWLHVDAKDAAICCVPVPSADDPLSVRLEPARVLAGRVVDLDGKPVADAEVHIVGDRTIFTGATYTEPSTWEFVCGRNLATTDSNGAFRFERLYDGVFAIELREPGAVDFAEVTKARSGTDQLVLRAGRAAALRTAFRGQLRDASTNAPVEHCRATVWRRGSSDSDWHGRNYDLDAPGGSFVLEGLAAGTMRLSFEARGFARLDLPARDFAAGAHTVDVALDPARSVTVEARAAGAPVNGRVRAHLGDGRWLQLPCGDRSTNDTIEIRGKVRLDGLPARAVTLVVERRGQPPVAQVVDLAQLRDTPVVFDLDVLDPVPQVHFGVVVMLAARDADAATWQGPVDRAWWLRAQQNAALSPPDREVKLTVETADGTVLARATIAPGEPRDGTAGERGPAFRCKVQQADGTGQEAPQSPVPAVSFHLRQQATVIRAEADGRADLVRRVEPAELQGSEPGIAIVLRPQ